MFLRNPWGTNCPNSRREIGQSLAKGGVAKKKGTVAKGKAEPAKAKGGAEFIDEKKCVWQVLAGKLVRFVVEPKGLRGYR